MSMGPASWNPFGAPPPPPGADFSYDPWGSSFGGGYPGFGFPPPSSGGYYDPPPHHRPHDHHDHGRSHSRGRSPPHSHHGHHHGHHPYNHHHEHDYNHHHGSHGHDYNHGYPPHSRHNDRERRDWEGGHRHSSRHDDRWGDDRGYHSYDDHPSHRQPSPPRGRSPPRNGRAGDIPPPPAPPIGGGGLRLTEDKLRELEPGANRSRSVGAPSVRSAKSAGGASSVGSVWRAIVDGPHSQYRRNQYHPEPHPSEVRKPTGKRMALCIGQNRGQRSEVATASTNIMRDFLRRHQFVVDEAIFDFDWDQFLADVEHGAEELKALAEPGDSVFLYAVGYDGAHEVMTDIIDALPAGVRLTCVFDGCHLRSSRSHLPFIIDDRIPRRRGKRRLAEPRGPSQMPRCDVFTFTGEDIEGGSSVYKTAKGAVAVYTAAFVRAFTRSDAKGYWNEPPSYVKIANSIRGEIHAIIAQVKQGSVRTLTSTAAAAKPYDIDQPAHL